MTKEKKPLDLTLVVACDNNGVIGMNNKIPWKNPEDMQLFKCRTEGHLVVMGRKTWESLGKALPNRGNVVVSSSFDKPCVVKQVDDQTVVYGINSLNLVRMVFNHYCCEFSPEATPFLIGGASLYSRALEDNLVDKIIISLIPGEHQGDTFFPDVNVGRWRLDYSVDYDTFKLQTFDNISKLNVNNWFSSSGINVDDED